jgi:NADPH-dependent 2,4-dienoyl-CoA reductase/sulfur reductase-like enzyme
MKGKLAMGGLILGAAWGAYRRLRTATSLEGSYAHAPTKILIIGGGFGGLSVARGLARALRGTEDVGVALVDRMNYTTFWPMVPSVIPSNADVRHVAHSLRRILRPLERVMNLGESRIEMRISRSAWFPRDLRFPHS